MVRSYHTYTVDDVKTTKQQILKWINRFEVCCFFDNNGYSSTHTSFECLAGAGVRSQPNLAGNLFAAIDTCIAETNDYVFAHFNYDLKNSVEKDLSSANPDRVAFPEYKLFIPEVVFELKSKSLTIGVFDLDADTIYVQLSQETQGLEEQMPSVKFNQRVEREEYISNVNKLLAHIKRGDCYEINYCMEFFAQATINPVTVFDLLNRLSPNPFASYYKYRDKYLICASMERYIRKYGTEIISQPIKGTSPRDHSCLEKDSENKNRLFNSKKERSENVMIVDLVRNDVGKVCAEGSVHVPELFAVYSYPNVHQMMSTVQGTLIPEAGLGAILKATFPMGSMTGAPKKKVMELAEKYESSKRGIYSGAIGYITPEKNFDFNVVIRSLVYNESRNYLSFHVGSAITFLSKPEDEYEECLLKGQAMLRLFNGEK